MGLPLHPTGPSQSSTRWNPTVHLPLACARHPYRSFAYTQLGAPRAIGDVLALQVSEHTTEQALGRDVAVVTRLAPAASLVGGFEAADPSRLLQVVGAAGLPLVPLDARPLEPTLRNTLTDLDQMPDRFGAWLRVAGVVRDQRLADLLGNALGRAAERGHNLWTGGWLTREGDPPDVPGMAAFLGLTPRGLRDAFARRSLPAPVRWKILARTLVHAVFVQAFPWEPLTRVALTLGYTDSQALSHAFQGCFGATPSLVRARLGWQWLAWRWWERQVARPEWRTADSLHASPAWRNHTCKPRPVGLNHGGP